MFFDPNDDNQVSNEPIDASNFLEEMRELFETDPDEVIDRLEEAGYSEEDL